MPGARSASETLSDLFTEEQAFTWQEDPLTASYEGQRTHDDRLGSDRPDDFARRAAAYATFLERLRAIDRGRLNAEERISCELFDFILTYRVKFAAYREWRAPLNSDSGFHTSVMQMHEAADTQSVAGYERYVSRLSDVKRYFADNVANMRQGLNDGYTLPADILPGVASAIEAEQFANPEDSPVYAPFEAFPDFIATADQARLREAAKSAIRSSVLPAYRDFQTFFRDEYMPRARKTIAASALPDGRSYYEDVVRYYATYDITPDEVHDIGLSEVARIRADWYERVRMTDLVVGATFAEHKILAVAGRGAMGVVYRARNEKLGREVALKVIAPELAEDREFRIRFQREPKCSQSKLLCP